MHERCRLQPTRLFFFVLVCMLPLASCENMNNQEKGALLGIVAGAVVGSVIGDGGGQAAAMAVGAVAGTIIGAKVGRTLDEFEELKAASARHSALNAPTGKQLSWESESNPDVGGSAVSVDEPKQKGQSVCRTVQEITVIGGEESKTSKAYCWNGSEWAPG